MAKARIPVAVVVGLGALCLLSCALIFSVGAWMLAASSPHPRPLEAKDTAALLPLGEEEAFDIDWAYWLSVNPEIVGWVRVPGTSISQPLVQPSPARADYYLAHDVYGNWNIWGCPYVDAACADGLNSRNVVVYGHNMGIAHTAFYDFACFHDRAYADDHGTILISTPDGDDIVLEACGVDTIAGWKAAKRVEFSCAEDYLVYAQSCLDACDVRLKSWKGSRLFTFCTCSYLLNPANERTLVYAQPVKADAVQSPSQAPFSDTR